MHEETAFRLPFLTACGLARLSPLITHPAILFSRYGSWLLKFFVIEPGHYCLPLSHKAPFLV
jgi:hypothetical protein